MQTFLPYPNFAASAMVLDRQRLNKQVLEARQILSAIQNGGGWRNHPAVRMWRGHTNALRLYHDVMLREWVRRGYKTTQSELLPPPTDDTLRQIWVESIIMPSWLGRGDFHSAHRAALLAKDPTHYSRFEWEEEPVIAYVWPLPEALAPADA